MSGKRRRSWEKDLNSKSGRPCYPNNDDISRDRHRDRNRSFDDEYTTTTRLPYRDGSRSRSRGREWQTFSDDRHNQYGRDDDVRKEYGDSRGDNLKESWSRKPDHSRFPHHGDVEDGRRQSNISKVQCKFFAVGKCYRDDCRFSHHQIPNSHPPHHHHPTSHDNTWHASDFSDNKNPSWDDVDHKKKKSSWDWDDNKNGPSWDDVDHKKKNSSWGWDDNSDNKNGHNVESGKKAASKSDGKTDSWNNIRKWDENVSEKNDYQHNEEPNQQYGQGQVSPKKKQFENADQQQEEKVQDQNRSRSPFSADKHKSSNEYDVSNNFGQGDCRKPTHSHNFKENFTSRSDYSRNRNSRNHHDDNDRDGRRQSNRISKIQCRFFAAGKCYRDDCKFSHDYDTNSHADLDFSEKNKSWNGPSWDDVESDHKKKSWGDASNDNKWDSHNSDDKKKSWDGFNERKWDSHNSVDKKNSYDGFKENKWDSHKSDDNKKSWDGSNERKWDSHNSDDKKKSTQDHNLDNKNVSWDEVDGIKSGNNINEKTKSWVKTDDAKWGNDSHLNNGSIHSEEAKQQIPEQNLTNAIDYLKSLPNSTHNQDRRAKEEGNIGNDVMEDEIPKKKNKHENRVAENAKQEQEQEKEKVNTGKVKEGNIGNVEKCMRHFRSALVECVKEILKPKWKEGKMTREVYKTVVKKVVDKITTTIQDNQIPTTQAKIEIYLTHSKNKIVKLVEGYVEKLVKA